MKLFSVSDPKIPSEQQKQQSFIKFWELQCQNNVYKCASVSALVNDKERSQNTIDN